MTVQNKGMSLLTVYDISEQRYVRTDSLYFRTTVCPYWQCMIFQNNDMSLLTVYDSSEQWYVPTDSIWQFRTTVCPYWQCM